MDGLEALATPDSMARLDQALKDVPAAAGPVIEGGGEVDQQQQQPAAAANDPSKKDPDSISTPGETPADTRATADDANKPNAADTSKDQKDKKDLKEQQQQPEKSKFAKDQERYNRNWDKLRADTESLRKEQETLRQEREQLQREREQQAVRTAKSRYTPEQYEQAAGQMVEQGRSYDLQAKGLDAEAQKLEDECKYKEAELARAKAQELKEAAIYQRKSAENAKAQAQHVRNNPDPTVQQVQQRNQQALRHFTLEAAKKWPEFAKEGGEFQQKVAAELQAAAKQGIDANENPSLMYHAVRLVAAETAAARVPGLEQELGQLKARVKELELETAPGGGQESARKGEVAAPNPEEMTTEQLGRQLSAQASQFLGR